MCSESMTLLIGMLLTRWCSLQHYVRSVMGSAHIMLQLQYGRPSIVRCLCHSCTSSCWLIGVNRWEGIVHPSVCYSATNTCSSSPFWDSQQPWNRHAVPSVGQTHRPHCQSRIFFRKEKTMTSCLRQHRSDMYLGDYVSTVAKRNGRILLFRSIHVLNTPCPREAAFSSVFDQGTLFLLLNLLSLLALARQWPSWTCLRSCHSRIHTHFLQEYPEP